MISFYGLKRLSQLVKYYVYILQCSDKTLYIGSTNNLKKRLAAHNTSKYGARYTKIRRPVILVYSENCKTRSNALKREHALKKLTRKEKLEVIGRFRDCVNGKELPPSIDAIKITLKESLRKEEL